MRVVTFGELLMRFSTPENLRFSQAKSYDVYIGGAEANIAIYLSQLQNDVRYITVVPDNELGKTALNELHQWKVNTDMVKSQGQKMGLYFLEKGASARGGNIIYDREGSSFSQIDEFTFDWDQILEGADWFHWTGITPALSKGAASACKSAIDAAKKRNIPISCDLNYRSKLWKYGVDPKEIMPQLIENCSVVIANEHDVVNYLGISPQNKDYKEVKGFGMRCYEFVSKAMAGQFPNIQYVISTLRETINASQNRWSGILFNGTDFIQGDVHEIDSIVDRVGGGDSFMAAFIHGKLHFNEDKKVLDFALEASAKKLSIQGDYYILDND
ncbi:MAG: sugar kinase [Bacteroidota bacterium]